MASTSAFWLDLRLSWIFSASEDGPETRVSDASYLRRVSVARSIERRPIGGYRGCFVLTTATFLGATGACLGQDAADTANTRLEEVVVQAKRQAADSQVTRQVEKTLTDDPWIYAEHITVTTKNGVVTLEGIVGDTGEMFRIVRLCRKIPGARRVVNALEIMHNDPDGG
jgi:osmotically-inducible protein OsmY